MSAVTDEADVWIKPSRDSGNWSITTKVVLQSRAPNSRREFEIPWIPRAINCESHANAQDVHNEFSRLAQEWKDETRFLSRIDQKTAHPAYRKIIDLGPPVIPLILDDLSNNGGYWFVALSEITKVDPAKNPNCSFKDLAAAWLDWGAKNVSGPRPSSGGSL